MVGSAGMLITPLCFHVFSFCFISYFSSMLLLFFFYLALDFVFISILFLMWHIGW